MATFPRLARNAPVARQPLQPDLMRRLQTRLQRQSRVSAERSPTKVEAMNRPREVSSTSTCPICKGAGFLRRDVALGHPQFGKPLVCRCQEQERQRKRRQRLWELSHLEAFTQKRFETFTPHTPRLQEALQRAVLFTTNPVGWLLVVGPHGCGKTHLAAATANACLEAGFVVLFASVPDLLDHLRATFAPSSTQSYSDLFSCMRTADVLVLDDLGTQHGSPWADEKLFQLFNHRYDASLPTVIATSPQGLQGVDERIRSRLSDRSLVTTLHLVQTSEGC